MKRKTPPCAGALSILHRLDGPLLQSVQEKSDFIVSALTGAPGVKSVMFYYFTSLPGFTSRPGMITARLPSLFSALRILSLIHI